MAVACFAIIAESDTTTTPDQAIDLPAPADLAAPISIAPPTATGANTIATVATVIAGRLDGSNIARVAGFPAKWFCESFRRPSDAVVDSAHPGATGRFWVSAVAPNL